MAQQRLDGLSLSPFLGDILIKAPSFRACSVAIDEALRRLQEHEFVVNREKSTLLPTQVLARLGVQTDTIRGMEIKFVRSLVSGDAVEQGTADDPSKTDGHVSVMPGNSRMARFHTRPLQRSLLPFLMTIMYRQHQRAKESA